MVLKKPPGTLKTTIRGWGGGKLLHRVHPAVYGPLQFNPSAEGQARFGPLLDRGGAVIPTLYAGTTLDCALMETVFHDVPFAPGPKLHSKAKHVEGKVYSTLRLREDLQLIDLTAIPLRKLGISPADLIVTTAASYSSTQAWAAALYERGTEADGLLWTSRQDDTAQSLILFGPRIKADAMVIERPSRSLLTSDGAACDEVQDLAFRLGVLLV